MTKSHYINGQWITGSGPILSSTNPANDQIVWLGNEASSHEIECAVTAAKQAFPAWSNNPISTRILFITAFADILAHNKESLAEEISKETGKPLWEAKGEVDAMINKIPISIEAYHTRCPEIYKSLNQAKSITRHRPHGILAVLGPFNFPGHLPNGHIIPALIAGNTIVFKPSELCPRVAHLIVEYWDKAGLPPGVLNLVQGKGDVGAKVSQHKDINGLLFTGSWRTGQHLAKMFADTPGKILALEMGGNNPLVIGRVDNTATAAYLTIQSAFITAGQRCSCARRLIIPKGKMGDDFLDELLKMSKNIRIGPYTLTPEPFMGPVISAKAADDILLKQEALIALGAIPLHPVTRLPLGKAFLSPGFIDVTGVQNVPDEEIFGPLLQVIRTESFQEAVEVANETKYGLTAGLLSNSENDYQLFANQIRAGVINWNTALTGASSAAPFGGLGCSGNLRPSAYYSADYCSYPVASMEAKTMIMPATMAPGISVR